MSLDHGVAVKERRKMRGRRSKLRIVECTVAMWNRFLDQGGSFADDHSTL